MKCIIRAKFMVFFFLAQACQTPAKNFIQVGELDYKVKQSYIVEPLASDWPESRPGLQRCVTQLFECSFDQEGRVKEVKALDISNPLFQDWTKEALQKWTFQANGKEGRAFVDFIYDPNVSTRILLINDEMAKKIQNKRLENRQKSSIIEKTPSSYPKKIKTQSPEYPYDAALHSEQGIVSLLFDLNAEGGPENIRIVSSFPSQIFDKVSLKAIKKWQYASLQDEPQSKRKDLSVKIVYSLQGSYDVNCDLGF